MNWFERLYKAFLFEDGKLSSTRFWKHIAYATATWIVIHMGTNITWEMMALYLAVIAADNRAGAIIRAKFSSNQMGSATPVRGAQETTTRDDELVSRGSQKTPDID